MLVIFERLKEKRQLAELHEKLLADRLEREQADRDALKIIKQKNNRISDYLIRQKRSNMGLFADTNNNGANDETTTQDTIKPKPGR
tara:strand:- start:540 stop:797 length:258 start_codon:yes stop_codon:yes gene_type:complete